MELSMAQFAALMGPEHSASNPAYSNKKLPALFMRFRLLLLAFDQIEAQLKRLVEIQRGEQIEQLDELLYDRLGSAPVAADVDQLVEARRQMEMARADLPFDDDRPVRRYFSFDEVPDELLLAKLEPEVLDASLCDLRKNAEAALGRSEPYSQFQPTASSRLTHANLAAHMIASEQDGVREARVQSGSAIGSVSVAIEGPGRAAEVASVTLTEFDSDGAALFPASLRWTEAGLNLSEHTPAAILGRIQAGLYTGASVRRADAYTVADEDECGLLERRWSFGRNWVGCYGFDGRECEIHPSFSQDDHLGWGYKYCECDWCSCTISWGPVACRRTCYQLRCHRCGSELVLRCTVCCRIVPKKIEPYVWVVVNETSCTYSDECDASGRQDGGDYRTRKSAEWKLPGKRIAARHWYRQRSYARKLAMLEAKRQVLNATHIAEMAALNARHVALQALQLALIAELSAELARACVTKRQPASAAGGSGGRPTSHDEAQRLAALRNVQRADIRRRSDQRTRYMPAKLETQQSKLARLVAAHGAAADALKARHAALQMTLTGKFAAAEAWRVQFCPDGAVKEDELCSEGELCSEEESEFDEEKELQSATLHVEQYLADCAVIEPEQGRTDAATLIRLFLAGRKEAHEARLAAKSAHRASPSVASSSSLSDAQDDLGRAHGGPDDRSCESAWCEHCCESVCICDSDEDPPDGPHPTAAAACLSPPAAPWPLQGRARLGLPEVHVHQRSPAESDAHARAVHSAAVASTSPVEYEDVD